MKHLAMDVASWWITWVLFGLIAWGGLGLLLVWAVHRFFCWQAGRASPAGKADEVLRCGCGDCLAARPVGDIEWAAMVRAIKESK